MTTNAEHTEHADIKNLTRCSAAEFVLSKANIQCEEECPFPFCVATETGRIRENLRSQLISARHSLGESVDGLAQLMDTSARSIYRLLEKEEVRKKATFGCEFCQQISTSVPECKSNTFTVIKKPYESNLTVNIILNAHHRANQAESLAVNDFIEYVFPYSNLTRGSSEHDMWTVKSIEQEEAKRFGLMCGAFNAYVMHIKVKSVVA